MYCLHFRGMAAEDPPEIFIAVYQTARCHVPEDHNLKTNAFLTMEALRGVNAVAWSSSIKWKN
jgi:hypothetical protein